jgi:hypothetical protein
MCECIVVCGVLFTIGLCFLIPGSIELPKVLNSPSQNKIDEYYSTVVDWCTTVNISNCTVFNANQLKLIDNNIDVNFGCYELYSESVDLFVLCSKVWHDYTYLLQTHVSDTTVKRTLTLFIIGMTFSGISAMAIIVILFVGMLGMLGMRR